MRATSKRGKKNMRTASLVRKKKITPRTKTLLSDIIAPWHLYISFFVGGGIAWQTYCKDMHPAFSFSCSCQVWGPHKEMYIKSFHIFIGELKRVRNTNIGTQKHRNTEVQKYKYWLCSCLSSRTDVHQSSLASMHTCLWSYLQHMCPFAVVCPWWAKPWRLSIAKGLILTAVLVVALIITGKIMGFRGAFIMLFLARCQIIAFNWMTTS